MRAISYTKIRATLAKTMEEVCQDHNPIMITRSTKEPVVIMSLEDYESMVETGYLLQSPANAERLGTAVDEIEALIAKRKKKKSRP